jgi:hypothetical protein
LVAVVLVLVVLVLVEKAAQALVDYLFTTHKVLQQIKL